MIKGLEKLALIKGLEKLALIKGLEKERPARDRRRSEMGLENEPLRRYR